MTNRKDQGKANGQAGPPDRANGHLGDSAKAPEGKAPEVPPGIEPLPIDGPAFVGAVHERVDLVKLEGRLLKSKDAKIVQRELAYLRDLKYGKGAAPCADEEPPQIIPDLRHRVAKES